MKKLLFLTSLLILTACADRSRRDEIDDRRDALIEHQETELQQAQERLAIVDSLLEQARADHDSLHAWVMANATQLSDTAEPVLRLNRLRAHRDSLDAEWRMLGAKIKYIRQKQAELDDDDDDFDDDDLRDDDLRDNDFDDDDLDDDDFNDDDLDDDDFNDDDFNDDDEE